MNGILTVADAVYDRMESGASLSPGYVAWHSVLLNVQVRDAVTGAPLSGATVKAQNSRVRDWGSVGGDAGADWVARHWSQWIALHKEQDVTDATGQVILPFAYQVHGGDQGEKEKYWHSIYDIHVEAPGYAAEDVQFRALPDNGFTKVVSLQRPNVVTESPATQETQADVTEKVDEYVEDKTVKALENAGLPTDNATVREVIKEVEVTSPESKTDMVRDIVGMLPALLTAAQPQQVSAPAAQPIQFPTEVPSFDEEPAHAGFMPGGWIGWAAAGLVGIGLLVTIMKNRSQ